MANNEISLLEGYKKEPVLGADQWLSSIRKQQLEAKVKEANEKFQDYFAKLSQLFDGTLKELNEMRRDLLEDSKDIKAKAVYFHKNQADGEMIKFNENVRIYNANNRLYFKFSELAGKPFNTFRAGVAPMATNNQTITVEDAIKPKMFTQKYKPESKRGGGRKQTESKRGGGSKQKLNKTKYRPN